MAEIPEEQRTPAPAPAPQRRPRGRPFVKGQPSPNPGGRPAVAREIREALRQRGEEFINELARLALSAKKEETRVRALELVAGYCWGRPQSSLAAEVKIDTVDREALARRVQARVEALLARSSAPAALLSSPTEAEQGDPADGSPRP